MQIREDYIYKNTDTGEHFRAFVFNDQIVIGNSSYPFPFAPDVQQPLVEVGPAKEFGHLLKKENNEFHEGNTLTVAVDKKGDLKVVK